MTSRFGILAFLIPIWCVVSSAAAQRAPMVPMESSPHPLVIEALDAEWLTPVERSGLRVRHGTWTPEDLELVEGAAHAVAMRAGLWHRIADDADAAPRIRAIALTRLGRTPEALEVLDDAGSDVPTLAEKAAILLDLGRSEEAIDLASLVVERSPETPESIEGAMAEVSALETRLLAGGGDPRDFERMLDVLGAARNRIDRLDPDVRLREGVLLLGRGNPGEGVPALHEAISFDPRRAETWRVLGTQAARTFDFDGAERAAAALDRIAAVASEDSEISHPDATIIRARVAMVRNDPDLAASLLDDLLERQPTRPDALALRAAVAAIRYDRQEESDWLARHDEIRPGGSGAWWETGRALAFDRQYERAANAFREAIRRNPRLAEPHIDLGMNQMQDARDVEARVSLERAVELDPYHKRAAFSLFLLEELDEFETIESEHFILRYRDGVDEVVALGMLGPLEAMHEDLAMRFRHEPDRKTVIELMPDHQFFGVRITGMPAIHTIAACTGPLIAIEVPREGPPTKHLGLFDWLRVLRHEYAHTITLSQTGNRIPHWFTEAAAVSIEDVPRTYETCQQLAQRWRTGTLFNLTDINFAFVRPKRPGDRAMAYAQGAWIVEFMNDRWGPDALVDLLELYDQGIQEKDAIPRILGVDTDAFQADFLAWAGERIAEWGLDPDPSLDELSDRLRTTDSVAVQAMVEARRERLRRIADRVSAGIGEPRSVGDDGDASMDPSSWPSLKRPPLAIGDDDLEAMLQEHPSHPDLLELRIRRGLKAGVAEEEILELIDRYAKARPVDPFPHRVLARQALDGTEPETAIPHLKELDVRSVKDPSYALEIARLSRSSRDHDTALAAAERAARMNAYDPATRELAAACAIEAGELVAARRHIAALLVLEPGQVRHQRRLDAIERLLERDGVGTD